MTTHDIADRTLIAVQTILAWEKPSREKLEELIGVKLSCEERAGGWTECVSSHTSNPDIQACRYTEHPRTTDRAAALTLIFAADSQPSVADLSKLKHTLGAWVSNIDGMPSGAGVNPFELPIFRREFPRAGRARVSLRHYRDGRAYSVHIEWIA